MTESSVLNQRWTALKSTVTGVCGIYDEKGEQLAIVTDTQQPDVVSTAMAATPDLMEACAIVYDWLQNDSTATATQVFREVQRALIKSRPWDVRFQEEGPNWGDEEECPK